ncbi:BspA family leucine-rich repeat surface protein [Helicobacter labetoulli]
MGGLFYNSTRRDFSGIESWNVSNVTHMNSMFKGAKFFNADISNEKYV